MLFQEQIWRTSSLNYCAIVLEYWDTLCFILHALFAVSVHTIYIE